MEFGIVPFQINLAWRGYKEGFVTAVLENKRERQRGAGTRTQKRGGKLSSRSTLSQEKVEPWCVAMFPADLHQEKCDTAAVLLSSFPSPCLCFPYLCQHYQTSKLCIWLDLLDSHLHIFAFPEASTQRLICLFLQHNGIGK